jgi:hypothetical protein
MLNLRVLNKGGGGAFGPDDVRPYGCILQDRLVPAGFENSHNRYLNTGLSVGVASLYGTIWNATADLLNTLPALCLDDQGVMQWLMVQKSAPISIDYNISVLGSVRLTNFYFDEAKCLWRIDKRDASIDYDFNQHKSPALLHHNGPKTAVSKFRDRIVECMFRNDHEKYVDFMANKTFFIDGIEKRFVDVCNGTNSPDPLRARAEGSLISCTREIFCLLNGTKRSIPNMDVFTSWGFDLSQVEHVPCVVLQIIPSGEPLGMKTNGQI